MAEEEEEEEVGGREAERRRRVKINKPSHRLTFGLVYLTMISSLPCFGSVLSALAYVNARVVPVSHALSL